MAFELPELPYAKDALTGVSAETLDYHHGKHHNTYVNTLNDMVAGTDPESGIVSAILAGSYGGLGRGAGVTLDVGGKLTIADGSFLVSESYGPGAAGDIHIRAGAIEIRGQGPDVFTGISADNYDVAAGPSARRGIAARCA